jgi:hypothetical protein
MSDAGSGRSGGGGRHHRETITGGELRRLLALRARLREAVVGQSRGTQREVLRAMEEARRRRENRDAAPWMPPAMATDELIREIKWRLDVASVPELDAAEAVLARAASAPPRRVDRDAPRPRGLDRPGSKDR